MSTIASLALYHFDSCPYCQRVRRAAARAGVELTLRSIHEDPRHRDDLVAARGRATVPVLRIERADGTVSWMPESRDIVRFLEQIAPTAGGGHPATTANGTPRASDRSAHTAASALSGTKLTMLAVALLLTLLAAARLALP